jgi:hypothetical protein
LNPFFLVLESDGATSPCDLIQISTFYGITFHLFCQANCYFFNFIKSVNFSVKNIKNLLLYPHYVIINRHGLNTTPPVDNVGIPFYFDLKMPLPLVRGVDYGFKKGSNWVFTKAC